MIEPASRVSGAPVPRRRTGTTVSQVTLAAAADSLTASSDSYSLSISSGQDSRLVVTENERRTSVPLEKVLTAMQRACPLDEVVPVARALEVWLSQRPVCDQEAFTSGLATLMWSQRAHERRHRGLRDLRWQVVVLRPDATIPVPWVPSTVTSKRTIKQIRESSRDRSAAREIARLSAGDVVVWACAQEPMVSSAVLANPTRVAKQSAEMLAVGEDDLRMVVAPGRPVAIAAPVGAARLSAESVAEHVTAPLVAAAKVGW